MSKKKYVVTIDYLLPGRGVFNDVFDVEAGGKNEAIQIAHEELRHKVNVLLGQKFNLLGMEAEETEAQA